MRTLALLAFATFVALSSAHAQSTFVTLDRLDGSSRVNTSAGFSFFTDDALDAINFALHTDLWGHYVHPSGGAFYATIPVTHVSGDGNDESAVGSLELGGGYLIRGPVGVALRAGLVLPTADDDFAGFITNAVATMTPRLTDIVSIAPDTTWFRLAASPLLRSGPWFLRADLGADIALDSDAEDKPDPFVRGNLGAGLETGQLAVTAELVTVGTTGDVDDGEDRFLHTGALSARFDAGRAKPGIAFVTPLDDGARGEIWAAILDVSVAVD